MKASKFERHIFLSDLAEMLNSTRGPAREYMGWFSFAAGACFVGPIWEEARSRGVIPGEISDLFDGTILIFPDNIRMLSGKIATSFGIPNDVVFNALMEGFTLHERRHSKQRGELAIRHVDGLCALCERAKTGELVSVGEYASLPGEADADAIMRRYLQRKYPEVYAAIYSGK